MYVLNNIRKRYLFALIMIATIVTAFTGLVQYSIRSQSDDARLINMAGMQRMLSQRIALHVHQLNSSSDDKKPKISENLISISQHFLNNHTYLTSGGQHQLSKELSKLYFFDKNPNLDTRTMQYGQLALELAGGNDLDQKQLSFFNTAYTDPLLSDLDAVVKQFEVEALHRVKTVGHLELALWLFTLFILAIEIRYIFRPMEKMIKKYFQSLEAQKRLAEELQHQAEAASRTKSKFLATMTHELRTPLNGVIGVLSLLKEGKLTEEQYQQIEVANNSAYSLLQIITNILDLCDIEENKIEEEGVDFKLGDVIQSSTENFLLIANSKGLKLDFRAHSNLDVMVNGSPTHLRKVLDHLIDNAIKFTAQGGIFINASIQPDGIFTCSIQDSGIGIPESKIDLIYEQFSQVDDSSTRQYDGTGIGLSICKNLVDMMNGSLNIDSEVGKGTTCIIKIPLTLVDSRPLPQQKDISEFSFANMQCLIVEDNPINQMILESLLHELDFNVEIAADGNQAMELLKNKKEPFHIIYMDCRMPNMNGYETTKAIRNGQCGAQHINTPILAVTANALKGDREKCLSSGMDDYLSKPIDKGELIKKSMRLIEQ